MANRLNVTGLDFDEIKTNLKSFLKQQSEFQDYDFEGSGLNVLMDVLAYNTHINAYYLNMVVNESFMDSAMLRNSVVSHAKKFGYTPYSMNTPMASVNVTVDSGTSTPGTLTIPKGYVFLSDQIDSRAYNFITLKDYTTTKSANSYTFSNVLIYEGQYMSYSYNYIQSSNPKQIFTIPDANIDTKTLTVQVCQSSSNTYTELYSLAMDALTVDANTNVYYIQEGQNGQYDIYFGDGVFGKKLPDGCIVTTTYISTNGPAANYANNFIGTQQIGGYSSIITQATSNSSYASGGTYKESVDEIKAAAPLNFLSQNRAVTKNDYINILAQKYPAFEAVNIWGGEENDPPVFGKVFIAAKPKLGFEVTDTVKEYVKNEILKPISMLTVSPEIVNVDYNYLKVISSVYYDATKTTLSSSEFETQIRNLIASFCNSNLNKFNSYFNYSGLERTISDFSNAIISNEIETYVGKKFRPDLINPNTYVLDYGIELERGRTTDNFSSTPNFIMLDDVSVQRECFFEEVPSSYTGLEGITVTNGGFGYTSTPTIEIVGDGTGAKAYATIVNGKVSKITVTSRGIGYTSASVRIIGGGGSIAAALPVLEGRYGQVRVAYYKIDDVTGEPTKVILNASSNNGQAGTIDYFLGRITIPAFNPLAVNNDFGDITIFMKPTSNIIQSKMNKMLVLDTSDPTSIIISPTIIK